MENPIRSVQLNTREKEIIKLLLEGYPNKKIANLLNFSSRALEYHLSKIYSQFFVSSRTELIIKLINQDSKTKDTDYSPVNLGNTKLKKIGKKNNIIEKSFFLASTKEMNAMKTVSHFIILSLAVVLVILLILGVFMAIRQAINPPWFY